MEKSCAEYLSSCSERFGLPGVVLEVGDAAQQDIILSVMVKKFCIPYRENVKNTRFT